jgi:kinesin family protein 2/24
VINPKILVHECKVKIDGITKYIDDSDFVFDNSFSENSTTEDVFNYSIEPSINTVLGFGNVTVFAYGQTGSGKTYTMVF